MSSGFFAPTQADVELEALALEGLKSGDPIETGTEYWEKNTAALMNASRRPALGEQPLRGSTKGGPDLDAQAYYYATEGSPELGHRFLVAAHETFALLATQPEMGWHSRLKRPAIESLRVFRVSGFERILILVTFLSRNSVSTRKPLPNGRGSYAKARDVHEAIRATTVRRREILFVRTEGA